MSLLGLGCKMAGLTVWPDLEDPQDDAKAEHGQCQLDRA